MNRTADQAPNRAKAFSLQPPITLLPEHRSFGRCSPLGISPPSYGANCVRSLLLEPDMEDLTDIIPIKFDFMDDFDESFDEDKQTSPSLGKS